MRIATWNLQSDRPLTKEREALLQNAIKKVNADVWVLTETWVNFSQAIGYRKVAESIPADDLKAWPDRRWVAIWVRDKLGASGLEAKQRTAAARVALGDGHHLIVFGTVLPWRSDAATELRGAAKFESSLAAQARDWERLRQRDDSLHAQDHLYVAGDFNQELDANGPTGTKLGCAALERTLSAGGLVCVTGGERDPLRAHGIKSIDHIVLDEMLVMTAHDAEFWPNEFPLSGAMSDHYGVCVEFGTE